LNPSNTTIALQGRDYLSGAPTEPRQGVSPPTSWNAEPASPKLTKPANGGQRRRFTPRRPDPNAEHQFDEFDPHLQHNKTSTPVAIIRAGDKGCPSKLAARFAKAKADAKGREKEILVGLTGIPHSVLDGRKQPCPKCGGDDRFRYDNEQNFAFCNQCFSTGNGDWIAALAWLLTEPDKDDVTQLEALKRAEQYLQGHPPMVKPIVMQPAAASTNGHSKPRKVYATVADAVAVYARELGPPSCSWSYSDGDGVLGFIYRWDFAATQDEPAHKEIRPITRVESGWACCAMPAPRPLYRLREVERADRVYVVEGEKAADALRETGLVATTSVGGARAARKTDWSPLAGKEVIILPDNDAAGTSYASQVIELLSGIKGWLCVRLLKLPGLPDKGDAADYVESRKAAGNSQPEISAEIERRANMTRPIELIRKAPQATNCYRPVKPGTLVKVRGGNSGASIGQIGTVTADRGEACEVTFNELDGDRILDVGKMDLALLNGAPLASTSGSPGQAAPLPAEQHAEAAHDDVQDFTSEVLGAGPPTADPVTKQAEPPAFTKMIDCWQLLQIETQHRFLVKNVLIAGQPCVIGGRTKSMKTSIAVDLAVSLGSGTKFLNTFATEQVNVGFWSGEVGETTIRETALRIADSKRVDLPDCTIQFSFGLPKLSRDDHLELLERLIRERAFDVAILDPLYLSLLSPETAGHASNVYAMGSLLQPISEIGQRTGCTIILLHHFRKSGQPNQDEPAALEELAQAGVAEWARQWCLLQRRTPYQDDGRHELWLRAGGAAGHGGLWGLNIEEGVLKPDDAHRRYWQVKILSAADARAGAKRAADDKRSERAAQRDEDDRKRMLEALQVHLKGETLRTLREVAGLSTERASKALRALVMTSRVEKVKVTKNGRKEDGYRLTGK